ncbi:MAG TPA: hypothetical protein VGB25_07010 [Candidatus Binatia bacterium]
MKLPPGNLAFFLVFVLMGTQGCATGQKPVPLNRAPVQASLKASEVPERDSCADRIDGARAGGLAGTVVGTIVGTVLGLPYLGLAYKLAGYAIGFTAGNSCANVAPAVNGNHSAKPAVQEAEARPAPPTVRTVKAIKEETL